MTGLSMGEMNVMRQNGGMKKHEHKHLANACVASH